MSLEIDGAANGGQLSDEALHQLFKQLRPEDIEQFYMAYQLWSQRQQVEQLQLQMLTLQNRIADNTAHMERIQPSAIALSTLAQLQGYGVEDIDLLDKMLERGDEWLDHSLQLLERCEQLDLVGGDYTQWCEHALEGAYDWIDSIADTNSLDKTGSSEAEALEIDLFIDELPGYVEARDKVTEDQLLNKLMSEDGGEGGAQKSVQLHTLQGPRITQPLPVLAEQHTLTLDEHATPEDDTKKVTIVKPAKLPRITQPLTPNEQNELAGAHGSTGDALLAASRVASKDELPFYLDDSLPTVSQATDADELPLHIADTLPSLQSNITEKMPIISNSPPFSTSSHTMVDAAEATTSDDTPVLAAEATTSDDTTKEIPITESETLIEERDADSSLSPPLASAGEQGTNTHIPATIKDEAADKDQVRILEETDTTDTNAQTIPTLMAQPVLAEYIEEHGPETVNSIESAAEIAPLSSEEESTVTHSDSRDPGESGNAAAVHEAVVQHDHGENAQVSANQPLEIVQPHVDLEELRQKKLGQRKKQGFFRWLLAKIFRH
ncbi:MAG: hypothetical protein PVS3B1_16860 [Ktedonobacteraceae bacterium]